MNELVHTILLVVAAAGVTILIRSFPFIVFGGNRQMPARVKRVADGLPPAIIAVLIVYCLKDSIVNLGIGDWGVAYASLIASAIAIGCVIVIHLWKKITLLSIAVGTVIYMILIRVL